MFEAGDAVEVCGKLKKVVDFLAGCDKEDLRLLSSFFEGDAKGPTDAKRFKKPVTVKKVYEKSMTLEVELSKTYVWEEKAEYFKPISGVREPVEPDEPALVGKEVNTNV